MSELGIIKINQHRLVFNNQLVHAALSECDDCVQALIKQRIKPIIVIHASTEGTCHRTVACATALIGQTRVIAHWASRLSAAGLTSAQLMIEPPGRNGKDGLMQPLQTLQALTALGVVPLVIHNKLTWSNEQTCPFQQDVAGTIAELLNASIVEPLSDNTWKKPLLNSSIPPPETCAI